MLGAAVCDIQLGLLVEAEEVVGARSLRIE